MLKDNEPAFKKRISHKPSDTEEVKTLKLIYQTFQEYPNEVKNFKFVAADLKKLPPIPYECTDVTGLFKSYKKLENQLDVMTECLK